MSAPALDRSMAYMVPTLPLPNTKIRDIGARLDSFELQRGMSDEVEERKAWDNCLHMVIRAKSFVPL